MKELTWKNFLSIKKWCNVLDHVSCYSVISEKILQIANDAYVLVKPYSSNEAEADKNGSLYIVKIFWAPARENINRYINRDVNIKIESSVSLPIELLNSTDGSYGELSQKKGAVEIATYNAIDGSVVHKQIKVDGFIYYYTGSEIDACQKPFVIEHQLK